jgi:hypothetical protein
VSLELLPPLPLCLQQPFPKAVLLLLLPPSLLPS